jgi:ankyrin repeat/BTB/POZ domain-containing protein 1
LDPFQILKAAWLLRVPRLEEFAARYLAYRLEKYIDLPDFVEAVRESAARIKDRQETDTIELIDDIRHYLSERFRLRFEGEGIEEMLGETDMAKDASGPSQDGQSSIDNQESRVAAEFDSLAGVQIRTLDGELAGDEFASDAINYQLLLGKIDNLLDTLDLDG